MAKVHKEIDDVMAAHNNELSYNNLSEMKYLESCIDEALRKYPPLPFLTRDCSIPYKIPGTDLLIEKGTNVTIPVLALQRDPKYYPNPMKFDPDRFSQSKTFDKNIPYFPFGEGPRVCIGLRMGKMQTKVGLIMLLSKFKYELGKDTPEEIAFIPQSVILAPVGGLKLKVSYRD